MKESQALRVIDHVQEEYGTGTERYLNHKNKPFGASFLELVGVARKRLMQFRT
jgi:hypothetical protein